MIRSLRVKNIQSHEDSKFDLSPGVNVVIGRSDTGKTTILRAIKKLTQNRPLGNALISTWGGAPLIEVSTKEGERILWTKDKAGTLYKLDDTEFRAFGAEVPEEIRGALNLNEINFQGQFDRPFLLDSSPGEVAQHFNRIAHLEVIDRAASNVQKWERQLQQDIRGGELRKTEIETELAQFEYLPDLEKQVTSLENLENYQTQVVQNITALQNTIQEIKRKEQQRDKLTPWLDLETMVNKALVLEEETQELGQTLNEIKNKEAELHDHTALQELEPQVDETLARIEARRTQSKGIKELEDHLQNITRAEARKVSKQTEVDKLEKQFHAWMPNVCPLCEQEIK